MKDVYLPPEEIKIALLRSLLEVRLKLEVYQDKTRREERLTIKDAQALVCLWEREKLIKEDIKVVDKTIKDSEIGNVKKSYIGGVFGVGE